MNEIIVKPFKKTFTWTLKQDVQTMKVLCCIIISAKGGYVFGRVCLFVCLSAGLLTDLHETFTRGVSRTKDQSITIAQ